MSSGAILFGLFSRHYLDSVMPLAMNLRIAEQYELTDPYELVRSGKWTLDAEAKMLTEVTTDINGDGKFNVHDITAAQRILAEFGE